MNFFTRLIITVLSVSIILPQGSVASQTISDSSANEQFSNSVETPALTGGANKRKTTDKSTRNDPPVIALTFDDGPRPSITNRILDVLEDYGARATFFVIGKNAEAYPDTVIRAKSIGCEIGNHTYDHKNLTCMNESGIEKQLNFADEVIYDILSEFPRLLRVPGCNYNRVIKDTVDMPIVLWSIDTRDWEYGLRNTAFNRQRVIDKVLEKVKDGDIVLMHDIYALSAECCETIIPKLCDAGFELVTVSELFNVKGVEPENGHIYYKAA